MILDELRAALTYDPFTGIFRWSHRHPNARWAGKIAGNVSSGGYRYISLRRERCLAHRLAWAFIFGDWPAKAIDHINGDRLDNRIDNLRAAASAQNAQNMRISRRNTSGFPGVYAYKGGPRWHVQMMAQGIEYHGGIFERFDDAVLSAKALKARIHPFQPRHREAA